MNQRSEPAGPELFGLEPVPKFVCGPYPLWLKNNFDCLQGFFLESNEEYKYKKLQ